MNQSPSSKIETVPQGIREIIQDIESGEIKIPAFQRGFVWSPDQILKLINSIYNQYPIGSILLWNTEERLNATRNIGAFLLPDVKPRYPINYVLDGQQRLSTLYAVFGTDKQQDHSVRDYTIEPEDFEVYFDLEKEEFWLQSHAPEGQVLTTSLFETSLFDKSIKLEYLLHVDKLMGQMKRIHERYHSKVTELMDRFINYKVPVIIIEGRPREQVGIIFERINNTGTRLSTLDLMVAWTWREDFHLKQEISEILEIIADKGFGDTDEKRILQSLSGIVQFTVRTEDILKLKSHEVIDSTPLLRRSLELTIDFLESQFKITSSDFLPHSHQLIPLSFFFSRKPTPSSSQLIVLKRWFWMTSFSRRYAGATDTRVDEDIQFMNQVLDNNYSGLKKYTIDVTQNLLISSEFSISSPLTRAFVLLLAQGEPRDLLTGGKVSIGRTLSKYNRKEYHHIFPRNFLKQKHVSKNINAISNFCILPSASNRNISDTPPSQYLFPHTAPNLFTIDHDTPVVDLNDRLRSNMMPINTRLYQDNDYQTFLEERSQIIFNSIIKVTTAGEL